MYRFLTSWRWIASIVLVLLAAGVMVRLGVWQWDRAHEKRAANDAIAAARSMKPRPASDLLPAQTDKQPAAADIWSPATVTGTYDVSRTILIRQRTFDEGLGFEVVVPLTSNDGITYLIDRGYVLAGATAEDTPDVPPAPTGEVTVTGAVQQTYRADISSTRVEQVGPYRSVRILDSVILSKNLGVPLAGGYISASHEVTADGSHIAPIKRIPTPELDDGPHLAYAVQWWIFAVMAVFGFGYVIRREAVTRLLASEDLDEDDLDGDRHADDAEATSEVVDPVTSS